MLLTIHTDRAAPRLAYTFNLVFGQWLQVPYRWVQSRAEYLAAEGPCLHYGRQRIREAEIFIPAGPLLFENGVRSHQIEVRLREGRPFFFSESVPEADFDFDLLAMIFHCVSRYEEYLPFVADAHGRFPADQSLAGRHGFLTVAPVDRWLLVLRKKLIARFSRLPVATPSYRFRPTYDIDLAWAYRHRPPWRLAGGGLRDLIRFQRNRLTERLAVLTGRRTDPFYTFPYLDALHQQLELEPRFFFLLAKFSRYDRGIAPDHPALHRLIRELADRYPVGIHPSYYTMENAGLIRTEQKRLERLTGRPVRHSRQHYLRLRLPTTYHALLAAGIGHDYTLGFADDIGFRAGTARSFPWYDLDREETTGLMIHPFQVMDATLRKYRSLSPDQAPDAVTPLIEETKRNGGVFRTLWHNSSFSTTEGWQGWRTAYETILREATGKNEMRNPL